MRISDWSSDVCSSDLSSPAGAQRAAVRADFENSFTRHEALRTRALYLIVLAFGLGGVGIQVSLVQMLPFLAYEAFSSATSPLQFGIASFMLCVFHFFLFSFFSLSLIYNSFFLF